MSKFRKQHMTIGWQDMIAANNTAPAAEASLREKASLVGRVGLLMLSVGTGAWRVRASMNKIARGLGIYWSAEHRIHLRRQRRDLHECALAPHYGRKH